MRECRRSFVLAGTQAFLKKITLQKWFAAGKRNAAARLAKELPIRKDFRHQFTDCYRPAAHFTRSVKTAFCSKPASQTFFRIGNKCESLIDSNCMRGTKLRAFPATATLFAKE